MTKVIPSTKAQNNFGLLIEEATEDKNDLVITKMGKPKVVMIDIKRYEKMLDALEVIQEQSSSSYQSKLQSAKKDIELGKTVTLKELEEKYL
jgi:prevent-host-death family protein